MRNLNLISIFLIALMFANNVNAQFSRQQAIDLLLNDVLSDDVGNVDIFSSLNSVTASVDLIDNDIITNPYAESWVFFSDDSPFASWYHGSRVIFVSAINGDYSISNVDIYPKGLSADFEEISSADRPDPVLMDGTAFTPNPEKVESNYNFALIIASMDNPRNWYNTSLIYNVLIQNYNYQEQNIHILYSWDGNSTATPNYNDLDGDGNFDDIDSEATYANIQTTITNLTTTLGHGDQLAVFFTGVPVQAVGPSVKMGFPIDANKIGLYDVSSISQAMENIDCGQMIFNFDVNSSIEVMSYFEATGNANALCQNRYLTGPTGQYENNYAEMYFSGGNYSEQLFYWASAARGYLPDVSEQAPWDFWEDFGQLGTENNGGGDYQSYIPNHPGDFALDVDGDNFIQMGEAFAYATMLNTWTIDDCHIPPNPFLPAPNPAQSDEFPFEEDLITIAGLSGFVINSQTLPIRNFIIADSLIVDNGAEISFADNSEIYINRIRESGAIPRAYLMGMQGTVIHFGDNMIMVNGNEDEITSKFWFEGDELTIGNNFYCENISFGSAGFNNLVLNEMETSNCEVGLFQHSSIEMDNGLFNSSFFLIYSNQVLVENCVFEKSENNYYSLYSNDSRIEIKNSFFKNLTEPGLSNISINNFTNFNIFNNAIKDNYYGLDIHNSGWGKTHIFRKNLISNNQNAGVNIFNTFAELDSNTIIINDGSGLRLLNNSQIELRGNPLATTVDQTQKIINNDPGHGGIQIYTDYASFPTYFHYNAIIGSSYLVYCPTTPPPLMPYKVQKNYWGIDISNPEPYLYPDNSYEWDPVFELEYGDNGISDVEALYQTGQQQFTDENYSGAKATFQQVVSQYPSTSFASASLKELYALEQYVAADYNGLKQFYVSDQNIQADSVLTELGGFLGNKCDVKMGNYPTAITWFEARIQNPPSFADSIYSIIDLGNTYQLMGNGGTKSSSYIGSMPQHKPENQVDHQQTTNYLLSLLPGPQDNMSEELRDNLYSLKAGELLQNIPNPFNGSTSIYYKLDAGATVAIQVYNSIGQIIKTIDEGVQEMGTHSTQFNANGLVNGMYFYTIQVNGKQTDTKKMNIVR